MNLTTTYLGLKLRTPLVPGASPLSADLDGLRQMEDAGAAAVVFHSLFEEQLRAQDATLRRALTHEDATHAEVPQYFPEAGAFPHSPERYLDKLARAKAALGIPIIASLNGTSFGGWTTVSREIERAGAAAIELNIYAIPTDPEVTAEDVELQYLTLLAALKAQVKIPIALKLAPFFTNFARFAQQLDARGVDGLVIFNRFYQPDIDLEARTVVSSLPLSTRADLRLPLRWIAMLRGRIRASLAATSGIANGADVLKAVMAGADVAMLCAALLRHGIGHLRTIEREMCEWLERHGIASLEEIRGCLSQARCPDPGAFERAQYLRAIGIEQVIEE